MIKNDEGKVILRYFQPVDKLIRVGNDYFSFTSQFGISLGFFNEEDVPKLLEVTGGCCDRKRKVISEATETQYEHWKFGKGGRK
jgi:hypothetical protein